MSRGRGNNLNQTEVRPLNSREVVHVYNYSDPHTGIHARVEQILETDPEKLHVSGFFYQTGEVVGHFTRHLHKDRQRVINHKMAIYDETLRKRGFNTRWAQRCEEWYRQQGFQEVVLDATISSIKTWLGKGYEPIAEEDDENRQARIDHALDLYHSGRGDEIHLELSEAFPMRKILV